MLCALFENMLQLSTCTIWGVVANFILIFMKLSYCVDFAFKSFVFGTSVISEDIGSHRNFPHDWSMVMVVQHSNSEGCDVHFATFNK